MTTSSTGCTIVQVLRNLRNTAAIRAYIKAGIEDTGDIYSGGIAGPQHIMRLQLSQAPMAADLADKSNLPLS